MSISLSWSYGWYDLKDENNLKLFTDAVSKEFGESMGYLFFNVEYPIRVKAIDPYNNVIEFEDCRGNLYCTNIKHYHRQYFKKAKNPNFENPPQREVKMLKEPSLEELVDMLSKFVTIRIQGVTIKDANHLQKHLSTIRSKMLKELIVNKKRLSDDLNKINEKVDFLSRIN